MGQDVGDGTGFPGLGEIITTTADSQNAMGEFIGDVTGYNDRYEPGIDARTKIEWFHATKRAREGGPGGGMIGNPKVGGAGSGLLAAWESLQLMLMNANNSAVASGISAPDTSIVITDKLATDQANAIMAFVFEAKLNGPVKSAGMGFSFGSPFFHMVVIPFGDSELTPMCWLS